MGSLSPWHWAILAAVMIVLFGAKRLPDTARALGKSLRIFKSEVRELQNESRSETSAARPVEPTEVRPVPSERVNPPAAPGQGQDARPV
ncbi:Sec-independent protein translocase subunit TatA [Mycobacterium sp. SM1]|uniref:Sec-independent protein translocase subunit TatA n=1 Tax=Mycobacterium sp. SM1 TaxID=2816243 RepID=UPI001BCD7AF9|nr:Sec-independent protein translocase subunit TatA [Mycobacterium sp. SM1]MBS4730453.1 Sec-independent protein translocase subunit TatA [Mycobacterium sp. SM1]